MGRRNYNTFIKKQKAEKKRKAKMEKRLKKESKKKESTSGNLEDMMAYVDEYGNIISVDSEDADQETAENPDQDKSQDKPSPPEKEEP